MGQKSRGATLTILAILFALVAITDILKPLHLEGPTTGLVFFGKRLAGTPDAILGPLLGIILLIYAAGIWRMRRYALGFGFAYAIYVTINLALFQMRNPPPASQAEIHSASCMSSLRSRSPGAPRFCSTGARPS